MDSPRAEKVAVVDEVRHRLSSSGAALLTEYRGLSVSELARLRRGVRQAGGEYRIYKNTLVRLAVRELGIDQLEALLTGPTALAFVVDGDAAGVAKVLRDFARSNPHLVVKGGILGEQVLSAAETGALAELPSRRDLLGRMAGALAAPMQRFAGLLVAVPQRLAYGLAALLDQRGAEAPPASAATDAPPAPTDAPPALAEAADRATGEPPAPTDAPPAPPAIAPGAADDPDLPDAHQTT